MINAPYDERNKKDYALMSEKIVRALDIIRSDLTISATEKSLAALVGCSRGTLRNRTYPLEQLKEIKRMRIGKEKNRPLLRLNPNYRLSVETYIEDKQRLKDQLGKSRSEVAVWVDKYFLLEVEVKKLRRLNSILRKTNELLDQQLKGLA